MNETNTFTPVAAPTAHIPYQFPSAGEIFRQAWALFKQRSNTLIQISLVPGVIIFVLDLFFTLAAPDKNQNPSSGTWILMGIYILAVSIISLPGYAGLVYNLKNAQAAPDFSESYKNSFQYIWPLFLTGLLTGLVVLGGIILLIVPGIIFALWFGQSSFVVLTENLKGAKAMKRSKFYVKGNMREILTKIAYLGGITIGLSFLLGLAGGILDAIFNTKIIGQVISAGFNIFWMPVAVAFTLIFFNHLKASKTENAVV